jgi:C1A family cysteine protease
MFFRAILVTLLVFVLVAHVIYTAPWVQSPSTIAYVNSKAPGWRAGINPRFENITVDQAKLLLGFVQNESNASNTTVGVGNVVLPDEFDARLQWPQCAQAVRDQQSCGDCWAFGSTSVFSFRLCIQSGGAVDLVMSPQYPTSCDTTNNGCNGGSITGVWNFFKTSGLVSESDYPFTSGSTAKSGTCNLNANAKKYYATSYRTLTSTLAMQQEM